MSNNSASNSRIWDDELYTALCLRVDAYTPSQMAQFVGVFAEQDFQALRRILQIPDTSGIDWDTLYFDGFDEHLDRNWTKHDRDMRSITQYFTAHAKH